MHGVVALLLRCQEQKSKLHDAGNAPDLTALGFTRGLTAEDCLIGPSPEATDKKLLSAIIPRTIFAAFRL